METILSDKTKFEHISNVDPSLTMVRLEDRINNFLKQLKTKELICESIYKLLYVSGFAPGILYGLAKIHKDNIPLRPILAAYKTAGYKIAKYLVPLIEPFASNDFTLKNSYEFYCSIQGLDNSNTTG